MKISLMQEMHIGKRGKIIVFLIQIRYTIEKCSGFLLRWRCEKK